MNILAIGDVVGQSGLDYLVRNLRKLQREVHADFTVVNGENASGRGLFPSDANAMFNAGADVVTLGNHSFSKRDIMTYLDDNRYILRPANYAASAAGQGVGVYDTNFGRIRVISLIGRANGMDFNVDNPFTVIKKILENSEPDIKFTVVDFHAEATSEKQAMGYYLDGKVSAIWGTHTHVPTADVKILPKSTGYITDLGMTGAEYSVIGSEVEQAVNFFFGIPKENFGQAQGTCKMEGAVFTLDLESGLCTAARSVRA